MKNQEIKFKNKNLSHSIFIGKNTINILPKKIKSLCPNTRSIALIIDSRVPKKYKSKLKKQLKSYKLLFLNFSANEKNKSINTVNYFLKLLLAKNLNRSDLIIGVGAE